MLAHTAVWADLIIPSGGDNTLNSGLESLACTNLAVSGTLNLNSSSLVLVRNAQINAGGVVNGGSGLLEVNASWSNSGTYNPGSSTLRFANTCGAGTVQVSGSTTFGNLTIDSGSGPLHIVLPANTVQTVNGNLAFTGTAKDIYIDGGPCSGIQLATGATVAGQDANVHLASGVWIGTTPPAGCTGGGGNGGGSNSVPVPATDGLGLTLLSSLLGALGGAALLRRKRSRPSTKQPAHHNVDRT
ncbi:hypothetical protein G7048_13305 [Diaphorobacter sp. HDW4B]|uniref:hypothetical protein n=1 Tax=Diaphorobacter sp. HDW4B TaxID=2714925 RepID=UPI00140B47FA|nr:hypothetical protein [Diaphorobacter sp. HDW4B]QIL71251.1 hypothetical protein G7048_13305 [Diaphorobacter sp. HDW4B]